MPRERARYLAVMLASLTAGYIIGSLRNTNIVIIGEEQIDTTDYTEWNEADHDWRSGF